MVEPGRADPRDKTVLIVDDEESILDLLDFLLKRQGFRAERASDGLEAVRKARAVRPDLVVLDLMLPKQEGFAVMRELREGATAATPIIVITGRYTDPDSGRIVRLEPNVREYLIKPIRTEEFENLVHRILGTRPA